MSILRQPTSCRLPLCIRSHVRIPAQYCHVPGKWSIREEILIGGGLGDYNVGHPGTTDMYRTGKVPGRTSGGRRDPLMEGRLVKEDFAT